MPCHRLWPPPPEVRVDDVGNQIHARTDRGDWFAGYVVCDGCGWLIGVGDGIESACHRSCVDRVPVVPGTPRMSLY